MGLITEKVTEARALIHEALLLCKDCSGRVVADLRLARADLDLVLERLEEPSLPPPENTEPNQGS